MSGFCLPRCRPNNRCPNCVTEHTPESAPEHVCGLMGFGRLGDECPACNSGVPESVSLTEKRSIPVTGVMLRRTGSDLHVLVEVAGDWYRCITEFHDGPISHIAEASGIKTWPKEAPDV